MKWFTLVIVIFFFYVLNNSAESIDWMPDEALRSAVRDELGLPTATPLTKAHMQELDIFRAIEKGISDLTGMEFAINLREADFSGNLIKDLRPLRDLIHLETLVLYVNRISDVSPLAGLTNLLTLRLSGNPISDLSPLAGLPKFKELEARRIWTTDFSPLEGLGLEIHHDEICEIMPFSPPVTERIQNRTFPSLTFDFHRLIYNTKPIRSLNQWDDPDNYYDVATKHDMHHYTHHFGLVWALTPTAPLGALSTQLAGNIEEVLEEYKKHDKNPNMLFIPAIAVHGYQGDELPPDTDFLLRDADGQIVIDDYRPWDIWMPDILHPKFQQLIIGRVVAVADCGFFDGVLFDSWDNTHLFFQSLHNTATEEEVIEAHITILKGIRERVRDDFLILVNRNERKSPRYAEWINGIYMEIRRDHQDGYSYEKLKEMEEAVSWNEKHLLEPRINVLHGEGVDQPIDSPDNLRWMRVITTLSLTHSDGYSMFVTPDPGGVMWHDFYDADLGRPVGGIETKGQLYENREGLFIREFTNGWAVYNRSGKPQDIQLPEQVSGWASGAKNKRWHTIPDLDGEIYLKSGLETLPTGQTTPAGDVNEDGVVNILDLVAVTNAFGEDTPDINGDGTVNVLDLVAVANAFE